MRWPLMFLIACGGSDPATPDSATDGPKPPTDVPGETCTRCPTPGTVESLGGAPGGLVEASGMVASREHPGVLYAHNDSGDTPRVFAFDDTGTPIATITLAAGAANVDWEDIAIGPCPTGSCIYVGDIGDNDLARTTKTIYRFAEPALSVGSMGGSMTISDVETFTFAYEDGRHNAETLLVHPTTGDVYVVTKEAIGVASSVFKLAAPLASDATIPKLVTLSFPSGNQPDVSGGDIDPCGSSILLRLGSTALFLLEPAGDFETAFSQLPRVLPIANEANGESITWDATGTGYYTVSEGAGAQIHRVACP